MVQIKYSLSVIICFLVMTWAVESSIRLGGNDDQNNLVEQLEAELLARLVQAKKRETIHAGDTSESGKTSIKLDNKDLDPKVAPPNGVPKKGKLLDIDIW